MDTELVWLHRLLSYAMIPGALIPFILILKNMQRQPLPHKWLAFFLGLSVLVDLLAWIVFIMGINPNYVSHLFRLFSIPFISVFFYQAIGRRSLKKPFLTVNVVYVIFLFTNLIYLQKISAINSYTQIFLSLIIICYCILYFYNLLNDLPAQQIQRLPLFWIVSGLFISYAGKLVVYSIVQYMTEILNDRLVVIWMLHNFLTLVGYALITVGVMVGSRFENSNLKSAD